MSEQLPSFHNIFIHTCKQPKCDFTTGENDEKISTVTESQHHPTKQKLLFNMEYLKTGEVICCCVTSMLLGVT